MTDKDNDTTPKLNPDYRKKNTVWWNKAPKEKRRLRRTVYKGIVSPEKNSNKAPGSLTDPRLF